MSKQRFLWDKIVRDGTISASSAVPGFPAAYIQNLLWPTFRWRAAGKSSEWVIIDKGASVVTRGMTFHGANFSSKAILELDKWSGGTWVGLCSVEEYSPSRGEGVAFWTATPSTKYRFRIVDPGNSASYVEFGSWLLGDYEELSRGYEYGATEDIDDISEIEHSLKGFISVAEGYEEDIKAVEYEVLTADAAKLKNVWNQVKKRRPFAFVGDSAEVINLVVNGDFTVNADGWTPVDCTLVSTSGFLAIIRTGGSVQRAYQFVTGLIVGETYKFRASVQSGDSGNEAFSFFVYDNPTINILLQFSGTSSGTMTEYSGYFTTTTTSIYVYLDKNSATPGYMLFDMVSVKECNKLNTMQLSLFCANYAEETLDEYWKRIRLAWEKVRVTDID